MTEAQAFWKRRSDAGVKRGPQPTAADRRRQAEEFDQRERRNIARWSDQRLRELVASVEAGNHNEIEGWEARSVAEVFELQFIKEELARRGWAPLQGVPGG